MRHLFFLMLLIIFSVGVVQAAENDNLNWAVGCDGFTSVGGGIVMTRDNTGDGSESYTITATDGQGNTIFGPLTDSSFVGSGVYVRPGVSFAWTVEPVANPLRVTVSSDAGNGFARQTIYTATGNCETLGAADSPTVPEEPATEEVVILDDEEVVFGILTLAELRALLGISPSVPLNTAPPRPEAMPELESTQPGYVIVDRVTANLRSGAGPQYTIVGQVEAGDELQVLGRNAARTWWLVDIGDLRGWINNELVLIVGDLTPVPEVPSEGEIFPPRFYVFREQPLLRSPFEGAAVLCRIAGDLEYVIAGQSRNGNWIAIETECNGGPVVGWLPFASGAIRNSGDLPIAIIPG